MCHFMVLQAKLLTALAECDKQSIPLYRSVFTLQMHHSFYICFACKYQLKAPLDESKMMTII